MGTLDVQSGGVQDPNANLYLQQQQSQGVGQTTGVESQQNIQKDYVIGSVDFVPPSQQTRSAAQIMGLPEPTHSGSAAGQWLAAPYMIARLDITAKNIAQEMLAKREADVIAGKEMTASKELGDASAAAIMGAAVAEAAGHLAAALGSAVSAGAGMKNLKDAHTLDTTEKTKMQQVEQHGTVGNDPHVKAAHERRKQEMDRITEKQRAGIHDEDARLNEMQNEHARLMNEQQMQIRHESTTAKDINSQRAELIRALGQASAGLGQAISSMAAGVYNSENAQITASKDINDKGLDQMTKSRDSMDQAISDAINALNQFIQAYGQTFRFTRN